jgi:hypothetical protein
MMLLDLDKWMAYNEDMKQKSENLKFRLNRAGIGCLPMRPEDDFRLKINSFMKETSYH